MGTILGILIASGSLVFLLMLLGMRGTDILSEIGRRHRLGIHAYNHDDPPPDD